MTSRLMSDAEIRRRKKFQGHLSQTTGALGLAALGTRLGAKGPAKLAAKVPKLKALTPAKMKDVSNTLATTGAGIGGAGSFNFAAYTAAESRKKKPVAKSEPSPFEDGIYGSETFAKGLGDWKTIDQRERTQTRSRKTMRQAGAAAAVGGTLMAVGHRGGGTGPAKNAAKIIGLHAKSDAKLGTKAKRIGRTALHHGSSNPDAGMVMGGSALVGGAAATAAGAKGTHTYQQHKINQRRRANFKKSSDVSAFGIEHD